MYTRTWHAVGYEYLNGNEWRQKWWLRSPTSACFLKSVCREVFICFYINLHGFDCQHVKGLQQVPVNEVNSSCYSDGCSQRANKWRILSEGAEASRECHLQRDVYRGEEFEGWDLRKWMCLFLSQGRLEGRDPLTCVLGASLGTQDSVPGIWFASLKLQTINILFS